MKLGRPKGRSRDNRSYGPLGDLIRSARLEKGLGLLDVARACQCSVQFVSNIEHGRAPLPWEKVPQLAQALKIPAEQIQAANLAVRSDFKSFVGNGKPRGVAKSGVIADAASVTAFAARDNHLHEVISKYQTASVESRKRFVRAALQLLNQ